LEGAGEQAPVVVVSAVALSEKVPDPALRPHSFILEPGELLDLDETAHDLVAAGYERVDQVEDRGQFAIRGGLLDIFPATEDRAPALADHWQDVSAAFRDRDARQLYVDANAIGETLEQRARIRLSSIDQDQPFAFRAQAADIQARSLSEAEPELEKLARSGYHTVVAFARHGEGERAAYNLGRLKVQWLDPAQNGSQRTDKRLLTFAHARLQQGFIAPQFHLAVIPEHRLFRRRRAPERPERARRRGILRSFADLRTGDIVVHEDHGIARFAGFDTKTVAGVTRDYLYLEYAGSDRVFVPVDQLAKISRYVGAGGAGSAGAAGGPPLSKLGGSRWDTLKARARRAAQELAGELLNLY